MKNLFKLIFFGALVFMITACKHSAKETEILTKYVDDSDSGVKDDENKAIKEVFTDHFGDKMEVSINEAQNTAVIHLNGKTYQLTKSEELPEYTASNAEYQYSNIHGNVTFLKKNVDMVLFHSKNGKKESTKMASY